MIDLEKLREFIWERCQADDHRTDEIMEYIRQLIEEVDMLQAENESLKKVYDAAVNAEAAMDLLNGREGDKSSLCKFCGAYEIDGFQGIIHKEGCPIHLLRNALQKYERRK